MTTRRTTKAPAAHGTASGKSFSLISDETFRRMYEAMLGSRLLEERTRREITSLRSRKQPMTAARPARPMLGQEAVVIGATLDLRPDDTITAPGSETIFRTPEKKAREKAAQTQQAQAERLRNVIAFAASQGAPLTIGAGVALANKDHANQRVVVAFGDAEAESLGAWNEALHLAGLHQLPIVFVLRPSSGPALPLADSIRERAALAGVIAIPVDSADAVAMYRVSFEAIARARKRTGATLIESTHYVLHNDTVPAAHAPQDPIERMEAYLAHKGLPFAKWKTRLFERFEKDR